MRFPQSHKNKILDFFYQKQINDQKNVYGRVNSFFNKNYVWLGKKLNL